MSGEPTFRIDGAEIFIGTDVNDNDAVYFLTNKRSLFKGAKKREVKGGNIKLIFLINFKFRIST